MDEHLLKLPDYSLRREVLDKVIKNDLNVSKTEELVNDILNDLTKEENVRTKNKI